MHRLLTLLMIVALTFGNGSVVAAALCEHRDFGAHAAALQSGDEGVAAEAVAEDAALAAASKKSSAAESAAAVASYILPADPLLLPMPGTGAPAPPGGDASRLAGRSVAPLLEPPLA